MIIKYFLVIVITIILTIPTYSASTNSGGAKKISSYESGYKRVIKAKKFEKKGKSEKAKKLYKEANSYFLKANKSDPMNPDTLNYLGFTTRKLGNLEDAEIYYLLGLDIDPEHTGINEYLGELYVITNRIDLANKRLEILKSCNCEEYEELKGIIQGTKKSKY
jgi:tetratricopeptide (TPR) repeat protein